MSSTMKIYCKNIEEYVDIKGGESLLQLAEALSERLGGMSPICASVNNKTEPLQYQVFAPKQVEFLDRRSASGERVYIRSLCMMLYCAVRQELPDVRLRIEHSIAGGYYCRLLTLSGNTYGVSDPAEMAEITGRLLGAMRSLQQRDVAFERKERLTSDIINKFRQGGQPDKVELLESVNELYTTYYRLDGVIDSYYGALAPSTGCLDTFNLIPYKRDSC